MNGENSGLFITFWVKWLLHFRMVCDNACCIKIKNILKLCVKSGNDGTGTPRWSHSGWDFKKQGKRVHWTSTGHETQFSTWVCTVLSFPERLQPITAAPMCTVIINVLVLRAFNPWS
jgi:hypothetical protein